MFTDACSNENTHQRFVYRHAPSIEEFLCGLRIWYGTIGDYLHSVREELYGGRNSQGPSVMNTGIHPCFPERIHHELLCLLPYETIHSYSVFVDGFCEHLNLFQFVEKIASGEILADGYRRPVLPIKDHRGQRHLVLIRQEFGLDVELTVRTHQFIIVIQFLVVLYVKSP